MENYPFFPKRLFAAPEWKWNQDVCESYFTKLPHCGCFGMFLDAYFVVGSGMSLYMKYRENAVDESDMDIDEINERRAIELRFLDGLDAFVNASCAFGIAPSVTLSVLDEYSGSTGDPFGPEAWDDDPLKVMEKFNEWVIEQGYSPSEAWVSQQKELDKTFANFMETQWKV